MRERWGGDARGRGVADAAGSAEALDRLRAAMLSPGWVAEEPEAHLLPALERACTRNGWRLARAEVVEHVLDVEVTASAASRRGLREVAHALVGSFAEVATHVAELPRAGDHALAVVVTTGMPQDDGRFAPHGHVVRLTVRAA